MDVLVHVWVFGMLGKDTSQEQHTLEMLSKIIRSVVEYIQRLNVIFNKFL